MKSQSDDRTDGTADQHLAAILRELTDRLQAGQAVDFQQVLADHPTHATEISELVPALQAIAVVSEGEEGSFTSGASKLPKHLRTLGDFQILREIGRGGMGVVYEAQQISLGRRVALKVLPFAGVLDHRQLQRFKHEAQAAALLHHQNIVPVHGIGSDRGVHFYAMQHIEGQTLAEVISDLRRLEGLEGDKESPDCSELAQNLTLGRFTSERPGAGGDQLTSDDVAPQDVSREAAETVRTPQAALSTELSTKSATYFRTVAELGIQVAEALEHAHDEGVVHRDIKPANLILDARGRVWVTDFGLAIVQADPGLTMTGDIVGTLRYMSPEQALGKRAIVDHHTDIYSLCATLYEMSTLHPIFIGTDRQELMKQIAFDEPWRPRKLNRFLPAEMETIIVKGLEKSPEHRYDSARQLADDLRRFLEDKPIHAKPPSLLQRTAKWSRRHKSIVVSAAVVLVLATLGLAISSLLLAHERNVAEAARESEQRQREQVSNLAQQLKLQLYDLRMEQAHAAVSYHEFERADRILRSCVPKRGEPDRRSFEWYYLWRSCQRVLNVPTLREGFSLHSAAYSRDGEYLALGLWSGGVALYDSESLELIWRSTSHLDVVNDILFTPDSELLITASRDKSLKVWQVATGEQRLSQPLNHAVSALAISADGEALATGFSQADQASREPIHISIWRLDRSAHEVMLEPLPDGELQGLVGHVHSLAISKNGRHLAGCCDDERIRVWDREDGQLLPLEAHSGTVRDLAFSPTDENMLASVSFEESVTEESVGEIKLWDIRDGSEIATLRLRALPRSIAFSHDGSQLIAGDHDGMVRIWNVDLLESVEKGSDRSDPASQPPLLHIAHQFSAHSKQVNDIVFSPNGQSILTVSHDQTAKIWSIRKLADEPSRFTGHGASILRLDASHDSRMLVSAGADGIAKLWDARTGREINIVEPESRVEHLLAADFSPDDKSLAIAGGYWRQPNGHMELFLWDLTTGARRVLFSGSTSGGNTSIGGVAFSPNGERVATAIGTEVRIWNVDTTELSKVLRGHTTYIYDVDWCAQTNRIATVGAGPTVELKLWDGASAKVLATLPVPDSVWRLVFSPNGQRIALATGGDVLLCDVDSRTFVQLDAHTDSVSDIAFSPDGRRLASASHDRTVKLWNLETGKLLLTFREPKNPVWSVCFSPDGRALFAAIDHLENSVIHVWRAATPKEAQVQLDTATDVSTHDSAQSGNEEGRR